MEVPNGPKDQVTTKLKSSVGNQDKAQVINR